MRKLPEPKACPHYDDLVEVLSRLGVEDPEDAAAAEITMLYAAARNRTVGKIKHRVDRSRNYANDPVAMRERTDAVGWHQEGLTRMEQDRAFVLRYLADRKIDPTELRRRPQPGQTVFLGPGCSRGHTAGMLFGDKVTLRRCGTNRCVECNRRRPRYDEDAVVYPIIEEVVQRRRRGWRGLANTAIAKQVSSYRNKAKQQELLKQREQREQ